MSDTNVTPLTPPGAANDMETAAASGGGAQTRPRNPQDDASQITPAIAGTRERSWMRTFARSIWMVLLAAAVLLGGVVGQRMLIAAKDEPRKRPAREKVSFVETASIKFGTYQPDLRLFGETVAGRRVELRALVAGDVKSVGEGLRDGGEVEAGDLLLTINPFDYQGAIVETKAELAGAQGRLSELKATLQSERDALKRDREQLAIAVKDVKKTEALVRRNAVSERLLDERNLTLSQRRQAAETRQNALTVQAARITQQEATIERLTWSLEQAEKRLKDTRLSAPFNAYVSDVNADVGRLLGASDRVATLFDRDWIEARFVLTNAQYGRLVAASQADRSPLIGRPVKVVWRVGETPIAYDAKVKRIGATIATGQGGVTMIARIEKPTAPVAIRPGAFVEVEMADRQYRAVARVPQTALYNNETVYVVEGERLRSRAVTVVGTDGAFALVQGTDLKAGDKIITTRLSTVGDGLKIEEL